MREKATPPSWEGGEEEPALWDSLEGGDAENDYDGEKPARTMCRTRVGLFEFGQNDAKRDSGSKLVRLGLVESLRIGRPFNGVVLSANAPTVLSGGDAELMAAHGIAGINCSWNRLEEIPFGKLGKARNHRTLPFMVAANQVNYGKAFKMNTAEALAAALVIVGARDDAEALLEPLSYGAEFLRLNDTAFDAYAAALDSDGVRAAEAAFLEEAQAGRRDSRPPASSDAGYLDGMDLPPSNSDDEYDDDDADNASCASHEDEPEVEDKTTSPAGPPRATDS